MKFQRLLMSLKSYENKIYIARNLEKTFGALFLLIIRIGRKQYNDLS
ncbi:MAG: hypothetical protein QXX04_01820 [Candidatus Aenigmatarchaeota archaeon]